MSWETTAWARRQTDGLTAHSKFVLVLLTDHVDARNLCWPSLPTLARDAMLARSTVAEIMNQLVRLGYVERLGVGVGQPASGRSMTYRVLTERLDPSGDRTPDLSDPSDLTGLHPSGDRTPDPSGDRTAPVRSDRTAPVRSDRTRIPMNPQEPPRAHSTFAEAFADALGRRGGES